MFSCLEYVVTYLYQLCSRTKLSWLNAEGGATSALSSQVDVALAYYTLNQRKKEVAALVDALVHDASEVEPLEQLKEKVLSCKGEQFPPETLGQFSKLLAQLAECDCLTTLHIDVAIVLLEAKGMGDTGASKGRWKRTYAAFCISESLGVDSSTADQTALLEHLLQYDALDAHACVELPENFAAAAEEIKNTALKAAQAQAAQANADAKDAVNALLNIAKGVDNQRSWKTDLSDASTFAAVEHASDHFFSRVAASMCKKKLKLCMGKQWLQCKL
jgi:hypothetical protein